VTKRGALRLLPELALVVACSARQPSPGDPPAAATAGPEAARPATAPGELETRVDPDVAFAAALAAGLSQACPPTPEDATSAAARERCADGLTTLSVLRDASQDPVLWGAQSPGAGYDVGRSRTTQMNGRVLRRLYLSTFAYGPGHHVQAVGDVVVLHVSSTFRPALDAGDYPYPFWHSADKWRSYERTRELLFFIRDGLVEAVLRSEEQDPDRPHVERAWDGRWSWESPRGAEPRNALYQALFSANNPFVPPLEAAYRAFEQAQRSSACVSCHDPSNRAKASPLELFSYPNQALSGRHDLVRELSENAMPPGTETAPSGIADPARREVLLGLARGFAELGDAALAFDGEPARP
jgi:hypothetical protein